MILETNSTAEVTPELLAKAFWDMEASEQARFWAAVNKEAFSTEGDLHQHRMDTQSYFMEKALDDDGRNALMSFAAPLFKHTLMACDKW